ncbi:hypothetical protein M3612_14010 [Niallia taxi]|uniref:hypothetical protein n=1 Tax=Niallia taxi TaxID=2499688 RepID=UPI00203DCB42|nr:hypothetical protein [Niallia taxi]MCM3215610.1 hypothetical protein [Niallia taxi]
MFDPTAYDNLKTVIEGLLYDKDLEGVINILDRKDMLNMSTMSREFHLAFALSDQKNAQLIFSLYASLENLASELLELEDKLDLVGANVKLTIVVRHENKQEIIELLQDLLRKIWGTEQIIKQEIRYQPLGSDNIVTNHITIVFSRLVTEGHIDDLAEMTDYMLATLAGLKRQKLLVDLGRRE